MKRIYLIVFSLILSFSFINVAKAANASISVTTNKSTVIVGESVTATVKVSSSSALGSWKFDVAFSSNLSLTSSSFGGTYIVESANSSNQTSKTYTFTFKAIKSGSATISVKNSLVYGYDESVMTTSNGSKTLKLMTQSELEATYSKNNNLKSLSVEGYTLTPNFSRDVLEYSIEVENGVESAKINATKEDSTATITGTGTVSLKEGVNAFSIVVTAQNGSSKTYKISITVKELDPIVVNVDGDTYTVIRKKELMPSASMYYKESTITINEEEIPSYYNENTNITLVGLTDSLGNSGLFIYENSKYTKYEEVSFNQISLKLLDMDENLIDGNYTKERIKIGEKTVLAYKKENSDFYLIYGLNLENGKTNLYKYDNLENTVQRYEDIKFDDSIYLIIIASLFGLLIISYIIFIIINCKNSKNTKKFLESTMLDINKIEIQKALNEESSESNDINSKKNGKKHKKGN